MNEEQNHFLHRFQTDAYLAMVAKMRAQAWAEGYDQCRRDVWAHAEGAVRPGHPLYDITAYIDRNSYSGLVNQAHREMLYKAHEAERKAMIALADLGRFTDLGPSTKT